MLFAMAVGHSALGQGGDAVEGLRRVLEGEPANHEARFRLAIACEQAGREREAIAEYGRLLDAVPDWLEPYPRLVRLLLKHNDVEGAARRLARQIALRPDPTALVGSAVVQVLRGRPASEALRLVDRALQLDPRHPVALKLRGELRGR